MSTSDQTFRPGQRVLVDRPQGGVREGKVVGADGGGVQVDIDGTVVTVMAMRLRPVPVQMELEPGEMGVDLRQLEQIINGLEHIGVMAGSLARSLRGLSMRLGREAA